MLALHRAAVTELLRRPLAAALGIAIPAGSIALIAATDLVSGAGGGVTRAALPILLPVLLVTVPFGALAAPVTDARERGILRLLATVPLLRGSLLLAHTPMALAAAACVSAAGLIAARAPLVALPGALAACAALSAIGLGLGGLAAALSHRSSQVRALGTLVPAVVLLTAGILPLESLLPGADNALEFLPTTALARSLGDTLSGGAPDLAPTMWIAAAGLALWAAAVLRSGR